jgi:gliding motility-associated protein GldM
MAGGANETPRQRMIGMMYLVLTALLALQVSNAVLDKFIFIDQALQQSTKVTSNANQNIFDGISNAVTEGGSRPKDVAVLDRAKKVRERTSEMMHELEDVRKGLTKATGGIDPETKRLKAEKDYDKLMLYMIFDASTNT